VTPFPIAGELLRGIKRLGAHCVIVSNTTYRDAEMYHRDFEELGWSEWIDECVTSIDVGWSKPNIRIFEAALVGARCSAGRCVMVGDSEEADIAPAAYLGMRSILVAIEKPPPPTSSADACAARLDEVLAILSSWQAKRALP
jgi:FMN phosphatase YigB (HAD superfamily)